MPQTAPTSPQSAAESDRPARMRRVLARAEALTAAGDWPALLQLGLGTNHHFMLPDSFALFLGAALEVGEAGPLAALLRQAVMCEMPPRFRAVMVRRLAAGGWPAMAMHLLVSDPATFTDPDAAMETALALFRITHEAGQRGAGDPALQLLHDTAASAYRRFVHKAPDRRHAAPHGFPPGDRASGILRRRHPLRVLRASGVPADAEVAWRAAAAEVEGRFAKTAAPQVHAWHDVFVNRFGQVWDREGRAVFSRRGPIPAASLSATAAAPALEDAALAVGSGDGNFGHWHCEWLAGLAWRLLAPEGSPARAVPLLIRDDAPAYVTEALRLAGETAPPAQVGEAIFVRRLFHTDMTLDHWGWANRFEALYARIAAAALAEAPPGPGPRLYLTRRGQPRRQLANEAALEAALQAEGFVPLALPARGLATQIRAIAEARIIVAPSGAALSHLILARSDAAVLELMPLVAGDILPRLFFAYLTQVRQQRHTIWLERADPHTEAWRVDIPGVLSALRPMLDGAG